MSFQSEVCTLNMTELVQYGDVDAQGSVTYANVDSEFCWQCLEALYHYSI